MQPYTLIRRQRKTLAMKLDKDGNITVIAPLYLPQSEIEAFILAHTDWLTKKRAELAAKNPLPSLTLSEGEKIPFFGKEYALYFWSKRSVKVQQDYIYLPKANAKNALISFYRKALKEYILSKIPDYAQTMGVQPTKIRINSARTRWGSCSANDALNFSYHLAMCDQFAVQYVVIHELCHILHKNHSQVFWNTLAAYCPDYKAAKHYLKQKLYYMEIL